MFPLLTVILWVYCYDNYVIWVISTVLYIFARNAVKFEFLKDVFFGSFFFFINQQLASAGFVIL
jgi:hypothetical protein